MSALCRGNYRYTGHTRTPDYMFYYQYVGHTINTIKARVSQHKSTITRGGGCRVFREHFTEVHSPENISIMPVHLLPAITSLKEREDIEETWMLKLKARGGGGGGGGGGG